MGFYLHTCTVRKRVQSQKTSTDGNGPRIMTVLNIDFATDSEKQTDRLAANPTLKWHFELKRCIGHTVYQEVYS